MSAYDAPNITLTNTPGEGPNIAIGVPMELVFHVVVDNRTWAVEEAFVIRTRLVANMSVRVNDQNELQADIKNSSLFTEFEVVRSKVKIPYDFFPLMNTAK